MSYKLTYLV